MGWVLQKTEVLFTFFSWGSVSPHSLETQIQGMDHIFLLVSLAQLYSDNRATHKKLP